LAFLAKVPPTAALAVFFILVGTDIKMFTAMIAFGVLPTMGQSVYIAARDVSDEFLYKAYTLGASNCEVIWNVIARTILPKLLDAIRLAIGPAVVYLIAAEMLCSDVGFGYRIRLQARLLNMNIVYPYLVLLAAFGFAMDYGLRGLQLILCRWYTREGE
jgi:NitT/TauT family transport system permease protein